MISGVIENLSKLFGASPKDMCPSVGVGYANGLAKSLVDRGFEVNEIGDETHRGYRFEMLNQHGMDIAIVFGKSREAKASDHPGVNVPQRFSNTPFSVVVKVGKDSMHKNFEFVNPVNTIKDGDNPRVRESKSNDYKNDVRGQEGLLNKIYDVLALCDKGDIYELKKVFGVDLQQDKNQSRGKENEPSMV